MPHQIWRPARDTDAGAVTSWHEHSYCRSERKAIVANHERLMADGQGPDPYYEEHFVAHHAWMERCLAVQRCQRRGLFGLNHGPRKGCSINSPDGAANGGSYSH